MAWAPDLLKHAFSRRLFRFVTFCLFVKLLGLWLHVFLLKYFLLVGHWLQKVFFFVWASGSICFPLFFFLSLSLFFFFFFFFKRFYVFTLASI